MRTINKTLRLPEALVALILLLNQAVPAFGLRPPSVVQGSGKSGLEEALHSEADSDLQGITHPFLNDMMERMDHVRQLAAFAQAKGRTDLVGFTPQELDLLREPMHPPFSTVFPWMLDDGRRVPVLIVVQRHTGDEGAPSKGGIRAYLHSEQLGSRDFLNVWEQELQTVPPGTPNRQVILQQRFEELAAFQPAQALAMLMSGKIALCNLQGELGGGKGVILALHVDGHGRIRQYKRNYSEQELVRLARGVGKILAGKGVIDPKSFIPAGDMGTEAMVPYWAEEYLKHKIRSGDEAFLQRFPDRTKLLGLARQAEAKEMPLLKYVAEYSRKKETPVPELGAVTGMPPELGGSAGRRDANGWLCRFAAEETVRVLFPDREKLERPLEGLTFVTHGWGAVGQSVTGVLGAPETGAVPIALSDWPGRYLEGFRPQDLGRIAAYRNEKGPLGRNPDTEIAELKERGVEGVESLAPEGDLLKMKASFLVLAAKERAFGGNADSVTAGMVFPIANGAISPEEYPILARKGIYAFPDTWLSAGGVIVSRFQMIQNGLGQYWSEEEVVAALREVNRQVKQDLWAAHSRLRELDPDIDLLTVADTLSYARLVERFVRPREIAWAGDLYPSQAQPASFDGQPGEIYASLRISRPPAALSRKELLEDLRVSPVDFMGDERFPQSVRQVIREQVEPALQARVIVSLGAGRTREVPLQGVSVSNVYPDLTMRVAGRLPLPDGFNEGSYPYQLQVTADRGRTWRTVQSQGLFKVEHGAAAGLEENPITVLQADAPKEVLALAGDRALALQVLDELNQTESLKRFAPSFQAVLPPEAAGSEEGSRFIPWAGAPDRVLVRPGPRRPLPDYPVKIAAYLEGVLRPFIQPYLRKEYGVSETPLVYLPESSARLGKPVYLFREALLPTGSSKPRMLAALLDLYLHGDRYHLTGRSGETLPTDLGTQSTGNHLQAMAWGGQMIRKAKGIGHDDLHVLGYTMRGIPQVKKENAERMGATVLDRYSSYAEAHEAMERTAQIEGDRFLHWHHGDRPIILGNMTSAIQLNRQINATPELKGKRIAVVSATGAGGRIAGLAAGLTQLGPDLMKVIGAETTRIPPLFKAVKEGKPVSIALPSERVAEDGIAVDETEADALAVFLKRGNAVGLVEPDTAVSYTHWLIRQLEALGWDGRKAHTEVVTGLSLALPFVHPGLFDDSDAIVIDETGKNIDPVDLREVRAAPLLEPMTEEVLKNDWKRLLEILNQIPPRHEKPRTMGHFFSEGRDERFSFVARVGGEVVGLLVGRPAEDQENAVYMPWMGVYHREGGPDFRRRGIGRRLMEELFSAVSRAGYRKVLWDVAETNEEAIQFYEGLEGARHVTTFPSDIPGGESLRRYEVLLQAHAGLEEKAEEASSRKEEGPVKWAGSHSIVQVVPEAPGVKSHAHPFMLEFWLDGGWGAVKDSLELHFSVENGGPPVEFVFGPGSIHLMSDQAGPYRSNHLVRVELPLPEPVWATLERRAYLPFKFRYRIRPAETSGESPPWKEAEGEGSIISQPSWLYQGAVYNINCKAFGGFDAVQKRLKDIREMGFTTLSLQKVFPGGTAFEIDDYLAADPELGGEAAFDRLVQEAHALGLKVIISWVPNHCSPKNLLIQENPHWPRQVLLVKENPYVPQQIVPAQDVSEKDTVTVSLSGREVRFWRGNVFPSWDGRDNTVPEKPDAGGFGPGTVQFNLWNPMVRAQMADFWVEKFFPHWIGRGVDGFYGDMGHSIHHIAPGWLEGIQRRIRTRYPKVAIGYEAHWKEHGGLIWRGGSFAQDHSRYDDYFRKMVRGEVTTGALMQRMRDLPLWLQQQALLFLQNHDEDPIARLIAESSPIAPEMRLAAHRALTALLVLNPGVPLINNGQEMGEREKWEVTGEPESYRVALQNADGQEVPRPARLDPFAADHLEAVALRQFTAALLRIRSDSDQLFWWAEGTRFLHVNDHHTFASYRAVGDKRALVVVNFNPSLKDPAAVFPVRVYLHSLNLSAEERERLRQAVAAAPALAEPALEPGSVSLIGDGQVLELRLKPFQALVFKFGAPSAAGLEEGAKLEWVGDVDPGTGWQKQIHSGERTVYFSLRLSPDSPLLFKPSVRKALAGVSYGANYTPHLPIRTRAVVRNRLERALRAHAVVWDGRPASQIPLEELRVVNVRPGAEFRVRGVLGSGVANLPEGHYAFKVVLSADRGQTWMESAGQGVFRRVPDPQSDLSDRKPFKIQPRLFTVMPADLLPDERQALERSVTQRIQTLSEASTSRPVVVLRTEDVERHPDLQEILDRLPAALAKAVIVWKEEVSGESAGARMEANGRRVFQGKEIDLANYLAILPEAASVVVVGDERLAYFLKSFLAPAGIDVAGQPMSLKEFLLALGVPGPVLQQIDPRTLSLDLARLRSA